MEEKVLKDLKDLVQSDWWIAFKKLMIYERDSSISQLIQWWTRQRDYVSDDFYRWKVSIINDIDWIIENEIERLSQPTE